MLDETSPDSGRRFFLRGMVHVSACFWAQPFLFLAQPSPYQKISRARGVLSKRVIRMTLGFFNIHIGISCALINIDRRAFIALRQCHIVHGIINFDQSAGS
ncbi:MAG: hypothetical protein ACRC6D_14990, partial [Aeromonas sp.]